jgi:hypothetical protein
MSGDRESLRPVVGANRALRKHLTLRDELILALLPTLVVLGVLAFVEVLSRQRLLFASLASSAFLIYYTRGPHPGLAALALRLRGVRLHHRDARQLLRRPGPRRGR